MQEIDKLEKVVKFCINAHTYNTKSGKPQRWGEFKYFVHLERVAQCLIQFGILDDDLILAAYGHDLLEDTNVTVEDMRRAGFTETAIDVVQRVTDEPGKNRRERKAKTYPKIRGHQGATAVKLADRIVNVEHSLQDGNYLDMYVKEYKSFEDGIKGEIDPPYLSIGKMWEHLNRLIDQGIVRTANVR